MDGGIRNPKQAQNCIAWALEEAVMSLQSFQCPSFCREPASGGVQHSPNYPDQVMEGFVHVERWVLGTGFYVWNLEGKAQLGKSSTEIHKALFPKTANSQRSRGTPLLSETPTEPQCQQP